MLRRGLLLARAPEIIDEAIDFCVNRSVAEIIWKCDAEAFNHGVTPLSIVKRYVDILNKSRPKLEAAGLIQSINPWITLNWSDRGREQQQLYPDFEWRVDGQGDQAAACPCLRSQAWRRHLCETYRLYASTKPNILWLEDDYKTFLAGGGCFCPSCLRAFSELVNQELDRASLLAQILAPGRPHPLRQQWIDFLSAEMVETCRQLETVVHAESKNTHLGIMASWSSDGRWWREAAHALAGELRPVARPSLAPYEEGRAVEFMPDRSDIIKEVKCFGPGVRCCPELENSPYTPFSKSVRMTRLQLGLSQLLGHNDITLNLFDMVGTPINEDIRIGQMLQDSKPLLDTLASASGPGGEFRGVGMVWDPRLADHIPLQPGENARALRTDAEGWAAPIQASGVPVVWHEMPVTAMTGRMAYALDDKSIRRLLSKGLLLDGSAAQSLTDMGYGAFLGLTIGDKLNHRRPLISAEEYFAPDFGGRTGCYLDARRYNSNMELYQLNLGDDTHEISSYVDPDETRVLPAMTAYENSLGGRIAVHAGNLSDYPQSSFMNWTRARQLVNVLRWLGHGRLELHVQGGAWMVPIRRDYQDYMLVGILNFETDDWNSVTVTLDWPDSTAPVRIQQASHAGGFEDIESSRASFIKGRTIRLELNTQLKALDFSALAFWKN